MPSAECLESSLARDSVKHLFDSHFKGQGFSIYPEQFNGLLTILLPKLADRDRSALVRSLWEQLGHIDGASAGGLPLTSLFDWLFNPASLANSACVIPGEAARNLLAQFEDVVDVANKEPPLAKEAPLDSRCGCRSDEGCEAKAVPDFGFEEVSAESLPVARGDSCRFGPLNVLADDAPYPPNGSDAVGRGFLMEELASRKLSLQDVWMQANFMLQLANLFKDHPYVEPGTTKLPHTLHYWVQRCRDAFSARKYAQAHEHLRQAIDGLATERRHVAVAFKRFNYDGSGRLDESRGRQMCVYLGWDLSNAKVLEVAQKCMDLQAFEGLVGRMGGVQRLFEHRRLRISAQRKDVCEYAGISVGARVRAHFYVQGQKSTSWREAKVLAVGFERRPLGGIGPVTYGVLLEFKFGKSKSLTRWRTQQVVPPTWVLTNVEDESISQALLDIGLDDDQVFWGLLLPESELHAVSQLQECQRKALLLVRAHAKDSSDAALQRVRDKFNRLGFAGRELDAVLSWVQDLAPIVVHIHLDRMGHFLEVDDYYRNQFETKTSCGALDSENRTRTGWEHDLFFGAYDGAKPFDRCKYGALNVMNDYRGVVTAQGYGDSYLVLRDVRLRCTFASTDSGGIQGSRLAVLDKYVHVLAEYNDNELKAIVDVAMAATAPTSMPAAELELLRGASEDPLGAWVTKGFPSIARSSGRYFFEVELEPGCQSPQVGLLSSRFEKRRGAQSTQGVGDDEHGWAVDGVNVAKWHAGVYSAWSWSWSADTTVVVGVAVDLDARTLTFASNGQWDEQPTFTIPEGVELFPALSIQGKASFNFGPSFKYGPPILADGSGSFYSRWAGGLEGVVTVHDARIGNESSMSIYKEVQIHGEVNLGRHVQRLVANPKYREKSKTGRSYALRVVGKSCMGGTFQRVGAHNDRPLYRCPSGAIIYFNGREQMWRMNAHEDFQTWIFQAASSGQEPPPKGWCMPDESRGIVAASAFYTALKRLKAVPLCSGGHAMGAKMNPQNVCGICGCTSVAFRCTSSCDYDMCETCHSEAREKLATGLQDSDWNRLKEALVTMDAKGDEIALKFHGKTSLAEEWKHLVSPPAGITPELAWSAAVDEMRSRLKGEYGLTEASIFETTHPYDAKRSSFRREVLFDGATALRIHFADKCRTLEDKARLRCFTGGVRRAIAGKGARVEVSTFDEKKVLGTVEECLQGGLWKVRLDHYEIVAKPESSEPTILPERPGWPAVGDQVEAKYRSKKWHKAVVASINDEDGTYLLDWSDGLTIDRTKQRKDIREVQEKKPKCKKGKKEKSLAASAEKGVLACTIRDIPRYQSLPSFSEPCFALCHQEPKSVRVDYVAGGETSLLIGDEIGAWELNRACPLTPICIANFLAHGPAQEKGVEAGWYLDLVATASGPSQGIIAQLMTGAGGFEPTPDVAPSSLTAAALLDAIFQNIEETFDRLCKLLTKGEAVLFFTNSSSPNQVEVLPEAHVRYGGDFCKVGVEIEEFHTVKGAVYVKNFRVKSGPAQAAGVRADWVLDIRKTLHLNPGLESFLMPTVVVGKVCTDVAPSIPPPIPDTSAPVVTEVNSVGDLELPADHLPILERTGTDGRHPHVVEGPVVLKRTVSTDARRKTFSVGACVEITGLDHDMHTEEWLGRRGVVIDIDDKGDPRVSFEDESIELFYHWEVMLVSDKARMVGCTGTDAGVVVAASPVAEDEKIVVAALVAVDKKVIEPEQLLDCADITLVFRQPYPKLTQRFQASGPAGSDSWKHWTVLGEYAELEFSTEGDGGDRPAECWGVLAVVVPDVEDAPADHVLTDFCSKWVELGERAYGVGEVPAIERDGWDETRLRALCARFGWEFEWMTEDGERRRRCRQRWQAVQPDAS